MLPTFRGSISTFILTCTFFFSTEFDIFAKVCEKSQLFKDAVAKFKLPEGFDVVIEPWPYGGRDRATDDSRYFQGLIFAQDKRSENPDSNFYAFPLPIIPVMDYHKKEIVRIDRLATGGKGEDPLAIPESIRENPIGHCTSAEYIPELLSNGTRKDLKQLNVLQPEGPSFKVAQDESLVEWQKWRFRVGFNPREGATIHDIRYNGRSVLYRLSLSEMVCI
jgi:primary-amine oxidase